MKLIPDIVLDYFESGDASPVLSPRIAAPDLRRGIKTRRAGRRVCDFRSRGRSADEFSDDADHRPGVLARGAWRVLPGLDDRVVLDGGPREPRLGAVHDVLPPAFRRGVGGLCRKHVAAPTRSPRWGPWPAFWDWTCCCRRVSGRRACGRQHGCCWARFRFCCCEIRATADVRASRAMVGRGNRRAGGGDPAWLLVGIAAAWTAVGGVGLWRDGCRVRRRLPVLVVHEDADAFLPPAVRHGLAGKLVVRQMGPDEPTDGAGVLLLPWILAASHGEAETGELAACGTLVGLSNLFVIGVNNYLMPKAAQAFTPARPPALDGVLRKATMYSVVVLGGLCVIAFFAGNALAGIVYGAEYGDTGMLVFMLSLATFIDALGLTASTGLWAMDRPSIILVGDIVQLVATLGWRCGWCFRWVRWGLPLRWWPGEPPGRSCVGWPSHVDRIRAL